MYLFSEMKKKMKRKIKRKNMKKKDEKKKDVSAISLSSLTSPLFFLADRFTKYNEENIAYTLSFLIKTTKFPRGK